MKDACDRRVHGTVRSSSGEGICGLRVELWDRDLAAPDIIGAARTGENGEYALELEAHRLRELFGDRRPFVFIKIFDCGELLRSTGRDRSDALESDLQIDVEVDRSRRDGLFAIDLSRPVELRDEPGGKPLATLRPGEVVTAIEPVAHGYRVRAGDREGWIRTADLDALVARLRDYSSERLPPLIAGRAVKSARRRLAAGDESPVLKDALEALATFDALGRHVPAVLRGEPDGFAGFDRALGALAASRMPPPRPASFTLASLRHEADLGALDAPRRFGNPSLPCLVDIGVISRFAGAVFRSSMRRGGQNIAAINDALWSGFWITGELLRAANRIETLHHATLGNDPQLAGIALSPPRPPGRDSQWSPGRFPGDPPGLAFDCRDEQWWRTVEVVRCCGETYEINSVNTEGCSDDIVEITGRGFNRSQIWPFPHEPDPDLETDPPHVATPGPLENHVLFPAHGGGFVRGRDYVSWSDSRVEVRLPGEAVDGPIEMRIFCERTVTGRAVDYVQCGIQTKLPDHRPRDAMLRTEIGRLSVTVTGRDESLEVTALGCTDVEINISAVRAVSVVITGGGREVPFAEGAAGMSRTIRGSVIVNESRYRQYTVAMTDSCGTTVEEVVTVNRVWAVDVSVPRSSYDAATTTSIPVTVSVPCPPGELGFPEFPIALALDPAGSPGLTLAPEVVLSADQRSVETALAVAPIACGPARIIATATRVGETPHSPGEARFELVGAPLSSTFTGTVTIALGAAALSDLLESTYPSRSISGTLVFTPDRAGVELFVDPILISRVGLDSVVVRQTNRAIGTYDCATGQISITGADFRIDAPFELSTNVFNATLTTGFSAPPGGFVAGATGSPLDLNTGAITLIGTAAGTGGVGNDADIVLTIAGTVAPIPLCCGDVS